jgi:hypothetical protein
MENRNPAGFKGRSGRLGSGRERNCGSCARRRARSWYNCAAFTDILALGLAHMKRCNISKKAHLDGIGCRSELEMLADGIAAMALKENISLHH